MLNQTAAFTGRSSRGSLFSSALFGEGREGGGAEVQNSKALSFLFRVFLLAICIYVGEFFWTVATKAPPKER